MDFWMSFKWILDGFCCGFRFLMDFGLVSMWSWSAAVAVAGRYAYGLLIWLFESLLHGSWMDFGWASSRGCGLLVTLHMDSFSMDPGGILIWLCLVVVAVAGFCACPWLLWLWLSFVAVAGCCGCG